VIFFSASVKKRIICTQLEMTRFAVLALTLAALRALTCAICQLSPRFLIKLMKCIVWFLATFENIAKESCYPVPFLIRTLGEIRRTQHTAFIYRRPL